MITDPLEQSIPVAGEFMVTDGESTIALNSTKPGFKSRYQNMFQQKLLNTQQFFHDTQCSFVQYNTAQELRDFAINPYRGRTTPQQNKI